MRIARFSQMFLAVFVTAVIVATEIASYGPNIDGGLPSLAENLQVVGVDALLIGAFTVAANGLFRWRRFGWWLSTTLDAMLVVLCLQMISGDLSLRFASTEEGRAAFRSDLMERTVVLFLCC